MVLIESDNDKFLLIAFQNEINVYNLKFVIRIILIALIIF